VQGAKKRSPLRQRIAEAEAEIARINGIIAKIDTRAGAAGSFTRDPKQPPSLSKARAGCLQARCSAPSKTGWKQVRNMTKRRADLEHRF